MEIGEETVEEVRSEYAKCGRQNEATVSTEALRKLASRIRRQSIPSEPTGRIENFKPDMLFLGDFF